MGCLVAFRYVNNCLVPFLPISFLFGGSEVCELTCVFGHMGVALLHVLLAFEHCVALPCVFFGI